VDVGQTILLIGHGSRDPDGKREFADLVERVRIAVPGMAVEAGVLEFADAAMPSADEAIDRCAARGVTDLRVLPVLLHTALHSRSDVPAVVTRGVERHRGLGLRVTAPLALEEPLLEILAERIGAVEEGVPSLSPPETAVLLVGRGSHDAGANADFFRTGRLFTERHGCRPVECCFVSLAQPDVATGLERCLRLGARRVIVAPYFVNTGVLVKRIAAQVAAARERRPEAELLLAAHLGIHPKLVELIRVRALDGDGHRDGRGDGGSPGEMETSTNGQSHPGLGSPWGPLTPPGATTPSFPLLERYGRGPAATEELSLRRVDDALRGAQSWHGPEAEIVRRIVYAGGDPDLAPLVRIHPDAVQAGLAALCGGEPVLTDVRMAAVALDRQRLAACGATICCAIDAPSAAEEAQRRGTTRAAAGMAMLADGLAGGIVVVGNAPTALLALLDLVDAGRAQPRLIIGTPVGFVAAAEAKAELAARATPFITVQGTRGGSALAAAALNALARLAVNEPFGAPQ
jgi:precorrin-8X/cobalt-precorrin-8 methylmutase